MSVILIAGYVAVALFTTFVLNYIRLHFFTQTDYSKYGAKKGAWALVTGAREGIGYGFAHALASKGFNVVLIARNEGGLKTVAGELESKYKVKTLVLPVDCSAPDAVSTIVSKVNNLDLGVVVNNVGVNTEFPTMFTETSQRDIDQMIAINVAFTTKFTHAIIPKLTSRSSRSLLVLLSSYSGVVPVPMMAVYSASKAYTDFFARSLATELVSSGIDVHSIVPHFVVSAMSGFSKPNFRVPLPIPFAKAALNKLSFAFSVAPHWMHDIEARLTPLLPEKLVGRYVSTLFYFSFLPLSLLPTLTLLYKYI